MSLDEYRKSTCEVFLRIARVERDPQEKQKEFCEKIRSTSVPNLSSGERETLELSTLCRAGSQLGRPDFDTARELKLLPEALAEVARVAFEDGSSASLIRLADIVTRADIAVQLMATRRFQLKYAKLNEFIENTKMVSNILGEYIKTIDCYLKKNRLIVSQIDWYLLGLAFFLRDAPRIDAILTRFVWWDDVSNSARSILQQDAKQLLRLALYQAPGLAQVAAEGGVLLNTVRAMASASLMETGSEPVIAEWAHRLENLTDPNDHRPAIRWLPYWATVQATQQFAKSNTADVHEDAATGALVAFLERWIGEWAGERFSHFAETGDSFDFLSLRLASKQGDIASKTDLGIIVNINIGKFIVKKFLLIQAKMSRKGVANVFSKGHQLTKLRKKNLELGCHAAMYAFYHDQQTGNYPAITLATPNSVLLQRLGKNGKEQVTKVEIEELEKEKTGEWDIKSFINSYNFAELFSFRFLDPESKFGHHWTSLKDAFSKMTIDPDKPGNEIFPKYVLAISLGKELEPKEVIHAAREATGEEFVSQKRILHVALAPELRALRDRLDNEALITATSPEIGEEDRQVNDPDFPRPDDALVLK